MENIENLEIEKQIIIESLEHPLLTREQVIYWFYNLRTINGKDLRSRKMLVDCFVNSVILHEDRIDFYFNYKEGAKTLSLKKLKKKFGYVNWLSTITAHPFWYNAYHQECAVFFCRKAWYMGVCEHVLYIF